MNRILITLLFLQSWHLSAASLFPTLSFGWDYNLGFTFGGGIIMNLEQNSSSSIQGVFIKYENSIFQKKGSNISSGYLKQDAMLFLRYGLNLMNLKKKKYPGKYFGAEFNLNLGLLYIKTGLMHSKNYPKQIPINFASGLGF